MEIKTFQQFEQFLKSRIPSREALFMGDIGLQRARYFMKLLGDPQNKIKVIHIAGTSGKGSTSHLISHMLHSQGFQVGMSISPHVFDIRERMQINNKLPNKKLVLKYFNEMLPMILKMEHCKYGMPTFFEINIALAYYMFEKEKLNYAIMETGLGGLLDATNTVTSKNKICIITKLGLDHTEILGNTISKIAEQKTGVIQKNNIVISTKQVQHAVSKIHEKCKEKHAKLFVVDQNNYKIFCSSPSNTIFNFRFQLLELQQLKLGLTGMHQAENCSLALACLAMLSQRDKFDIHDKALRKSLETITISGRMEIKKVANQTVIIDGAHNPQKMRTFIRNLSKIYSNEKFTFIVAFKKGKEYQGMLKSLAPLADKIYLTHFSIKNQDNHWSSINNREISNYLKSNNFKKIEVIGNEKSEILKVIEKSKKSIVITGSLYLISRLHSFIEKAAVK